MAFRCPQMLDFLCISKMMMSQALAVLISDGIIVLLTWLLMKHFPPILPLVGVFVAQLVLSACWCTAAHQWYFGRYKAQKTAPTPCKIQEVIFKQKLTNRSHSGKICMLFN